MMDPSNQIEKAIMTGYESVMALIHAQKDERTIAEMVYTLAYDRDLTQEQMMDIFMEFAATHYMMGWINGADTQDQDQDLDWQWG
jgi:hypothetical protein